VLVIFAVLVGAPKPAPKAYFTVWVPVAAVGIEVAAAPVIVVVIAAARAITVIVLAAIPVVLIPVIIVSVVAASRLGPVPALLRLIVAKPRAHGVARPVQKSPVVAVVISLPPVIAALTVAISRVAMAVFSIIIVHIVTSPVRVAAARVVPALTIILVHIPAPPAVGFVIAKPRSHLIARALEKAALIAVVIAGAAIAIIVVLAVVTPVLYRAIIVVIV
jgi:hypothetical protein